MTDITQHFTDAQFSPADDEIVGRLNFRGDIRHADWGVVGPTWDGRRFTPVMAEYDPETDRTTAFYRRAGREAGIRRVEVQP